MIQNITNPMVAYEKFSMRARTMDHDYEMADWSTRGSMIGRFHLATEVVNFGSVSGWLDVGCGPGSFFQDVDTECWRVGVDFVPEMVAMASGRVPDAEFHVAKADSIPFPSNSFDLVTMVGLLQEGGAANEIINELCRVCAPGGIIYITTRNMNWDRLRDISADSATNWYDVRELTELFQLSGADIAYVGGYVPKTRTIVSINESATMFIFATMPVARILDDTELEES